LRRVSWQELRSICLLVGCTPSRQKGDHLVMTRHDLARPVIIKMDSNLGPDLIHSVRRTLGLSTKEFEKLIDQVRGIRKGST
jgi:predicted RNA binding protein YcfA (HicA-like mRNA interferase family)